MITEWTCSPIIAQLIIYSLQIYVIYIYIHPTVKILWQSLQDTMNIASLMHRKKFKENLLQASRRKHTIYSLPATEWKMENAEVFMHHYLR